MNQSLIVRPYLAKAAIHAIVNRRAWRFPR
jgi:hypothetical protein